MLKYEAENDARIYPCEDCGKMRSRAEGGTTFTVCDACWDEHYAKMALKYPQKK